VLINPFDEKKVGSKNRKKLEKSGKNSEEVEGREMRGNIEHRMTGSGTETALELAGEAVRLRRDGPTLR
jgi:hypothetical protein